MAEFYKDLRLQNRLIDRQTSDREYIDLQASNSGDLATVEGRENLAQAIVNRLLTRKGELRLFGHTAYGSRLYLLVGELNNRRTRARAELYIRECLRQEPRIHEVSEVRFNEPTRDIDRNVLKAYVTVVPIGESSPISLTLPIAI
ncbi:MAG: DUF2634 domain-containing protein [Bacteroidota bacterium]